jgi:hypothetical protein
VRLTMTLPTPRPPVDIRPELSGLLAELGVWLDEQHPVPIAFSVSTTGDEVRIVTEGDHEVLFFETPGSLHLLMPLTDVVPDDKQGAAVAYLSRLYPIPTAYRQMAEYRSSASGQISLYELLTMPLTFSAVLVDDALRLVAALLLALAGE